MRLRTAFRRGLIAAGSVALAAAVVAPSAAATETEAGLFGGTSTVSMNSNPTLLRGCANIPPASGSTKINWTYNSATGQRGATFDGCVWINRLGATSASLKAEYLRSNNSVIATKNFSCSKNLTANPYHKCVIPAGTTTFGMPLTTGLAKVRLTLVTTNPASAPAVTTVVPGSATETDTAAMNSAPSYLRGCANVPPASGNTNINWTIQTSGQVTVTFDGCLWINRLAATSSRLTVEYRRANGSLINTRTLNCSKNLTANPYKKCETLGLNQTLTGLDRVVLKLQTVSPASPMSTLTVISGD